MEKFWFGKAKEFLEVAKESKDRHPWLSCFASQQSVEFALKGILLKYKGSFPFTHDLSELLEVIAKEFSVEVPEDVMKDADFLTSHYTLSRYSMVTSYNSRRAESCISSAERILMWLRGKFNEVSEIVG